MIVDAHLHAVSIDRVSYPLAPVDLPNGAWYLTDRVVDAAALARLQRECGVDCGVLVQPVGAYGTDNRYVLDAASVDPGRFASLVVVDPTAPTAVACLEGCLDAGASGVRLFDIPSADPPWLGRDSGWPFIDRAVERGARVVVTVMAEGMAAVASVLDRRPSPVALDHCGFVDLDTVDGWQALVALGRFANLRLKVTSHVLHHVADPARTVRSLADEFGADRLMWGSDFCQTQWGTYAELVELARAACEFLSTEEADAYLGGTALAMWPELQPGSTATPRP